MRIFYIISFLLAFTFSFAQQTKQVYFIGNSYTATGNIPNLIKQIANTSGDELIFTAHTPGGATLQQHASNPSVATTIQQGNWDNVVLQEQSQLPSFPDSQFNTMVLPYAEQLSNLIKQHNPCAETTFYMTWGRKNGDSQNCPMNPSVCTYEGMDDLINQRYRLMAELNDGIISPVGAVWRYIRTNHPQVELFSADGSHPSAIGSIASAYTFYTAIFKKSPYDGNFTNNLPEETILIIKEAVQEVVFNSMEEWHLLESQPQANFEFSISGLEVSFTNTSTQAESYTWEFGDGSISTEQNPTHIFSQPGIYTTKLQVDKCGKFDVIEKTIDLMEMNVHDEKSIKIRIYPNPTTDFLHFSSKISINELMIYDLNGKTIIPNYTFKNNSISIDVRNLISGFYFLILKSENNIQKIPFLKK